MECPRCGFQQADTLECGRCGIVFRKWQARDDVPAGAAVPAPVPSAARAAGVALPGPPPPSSAGARAAKPPWFPIPRPAVRDAASSLARLLHAGLGLPEALRTLATGAGPRLRGCLVAMGTDLEGGASLADAASRHPELFDASALQALRAAERTGSLPQALEALAARLDSSLEVRRQLLRSALYPLGVLATSIVLGPIPELVTGSAGAYAAKVLGNLALVAGLAFVAAVVVPRVLRTTSLGTTLRRAAWRLPWPASVYRHAVRATFCRAFADHLEAGLPLYDALQAAADVTVDPFAADAATSAAAMLEQGSALAVSLGASGFVPAGDLMVLIAGERAGTMVEALRGLATTYGDRLARGVRGLLRAFGVLMTIVIFAWVAVGIIEAFTQVSQGSEDIFRMIEKEMPYEFK
ncbi:MAG: type II secretion system F family protein [Deltaproteobacteria bacterium]|nr:type II secretion system F family protein [Deltaproteobacteria bacterium]MCB9788127.1 type II secretion system F family protein [Deltaproteobacteria bacterium]